jgi:alkanesulfonate monooxygenase SsuD/methylene tetrahydromethanopterin reductase-like flavin-dependent oxidoreductase (luciferase family)
LLGLPQPGARRQDGGDTISAGRFELGLGAGWKQDEWVAYGYGFPSLHDRLGALRDTLEILTRMLVPGEIATYEGPYAHVEGAINLPRGLQVPRIPILVGGNGPEVTWRLAARYADELNLDGPGPDEVAGMLPVIRSRCEEIGRDPSSLRVSVHMWSDDTGQSGSLRVDRLAAYRELGIARVTGFIHASATSDDALEAFAADAVAAGATIG